MLTFARPLVSALTTLTLLCSVVAPASAAAGDARTAVLGFDSDAAGVATLTEALRKEVDTRATAVDTQMSLVELKLTLGCEDDDDRCIADGGASLGADVLLVGSVSSGSGGQYEVTVKMLDVASKSVSKTAKGSYAALDAAAAKALADQLYGAAEPPAESEPAVTTSEEGPIAEEGPVAEESGGYEWGRQENTPGWKWAGFATSGILMLGALGTAIGTTIAIGPNGGVRKDLLAAAEDSLTDGSNSNDIDPNTSEDLCVLARKEVNAGEVTNAAVTEVCNKADNLSTVSLITWIGTGVFAASTLVFTGLLFIHKKSPTSEALLRHRVRLGAAPTLDGGLSLGGSLRF